VEEKEAFSIKGHPSGLYWRVEPQPSVSHGCTFVVEKIGWRNLKEGR
jgi:hypothetical protein